MKKTLLSAAAVLAGLTAFPAFAYLPHHISDSATRVTRRTLEKSFRSTDVLKPLKSSLMRATAKDATTGRRLLERAIRRANAAAQNQQPRMNRRTILRTMPSSMLPPSLVRTGNAAPDRPTSRSIRNDRERDVLAEIAGERTE